MRSNLFAYTAPGGGYPEYLSLNREADGLLTLTMRGEARINARGDIEPGATVKIALPDDELARLIASVRRDDWLFRPAYGDDPFRVRNRETNVAASMSVEGQVEFWPAASTFGG